MRNFVTLFISLLMVSSYCYSQVIDQAQLEIIYKYEMIGNHAQPERKIKDETMLLIGNKYTAYYSFMNYISDSLRKANPAEFSPQITDGNGRVLRPGETADEIIAKGGIPVVIPARMKVPTNIYNREHYYIERPSGKLMYMDKVVSMQGVNYYSYIETLENLKWTISGDTEMLIGYPCQKAATHCGGRDWTVWFTPEIPVSEGPWKLRGLPGLILKAETTDGEFSLMATTVNRSSGRAIVKDQENIYREISKKGLFRLKDDARNSIAPGNYNTIEVFE